MSPPPTDACARFAAARAAVATSWGHPGGPDQPHSPELAALVSEVLTGTDPASRTKSTWLLLGALTGALPSVTEVEDAWLTLSTGGAADLVAATVASAAEPMRSRLSECASGTLVDVTITAGSDNYSGVVRVVRQLVSAWGEPPGVEYVVWEALGMRTVNAEERARLGLAPPAARPPGSWVVPWDARLVVPEVLRPEAHATSVEAMAYAGVIDLRGIVYDLASLVEPHPDATRGPFLHHLAAMSRASHVSGISPSVTADVDDYYSIFARNGRATPRTECHVLPEEGGWLGDVDDLVADLDAQLRGDRAWPVVAVVSSVHPRKNHRRLLAACEQLWDEGLRFRLLAIEGTGSRVPSVVTAVDRLVEHGRPVTLLSHVAEPMLKAAYRLAKVSAYVSLAEGYGLPIVESLAAGTPVVASGHGSMAELAESGGVLQVDPRDESSIADGLRRALTDPVAYDGLLAGVAARQSSTWADYAGSVGRFLGVVADRTDDRIDELDIEPDLTLDSQGSGRTA